MAEIRQDCMRLRQEQEAEQKSWLGRSCFLFNSPGDFIGIEASKTRNVMGFEQIETREASKLLRNPIDYGGIIDKRWSIDEHMGL